MSYKTHYAKPASDQVLTLRVATRFQKFALSSDPDENKGHGRRPPLRWKEWLDTTQAGGKRMVSNPNPDPLARNRHPQVSFNSALKNDAFRAKAMEAFKRWVAKADAKSEGKPKGKAPGSDTKPEEKKLPEGKKEAPEQKSEAPKKSWGDRLKGLGQKARDFVANAPKEARKFIEDDAFRRKTMQGVHKSLTEAPEKLVKNVVKTVKHEVHEYKEAGQGIASAIRGKKMSPGQKKAVKTVATHLAIGVAAAALTASSPIGVAGALVKGMSRHIALKAVSRALGHLHVLEELGHIGHGVSGLMTHLASMHNPQIFLFRAADEAAQGGDPNVDEVFGNFITASVAKELENFDDDAMESSLRFLDEGEEEPPEEEPVAEESDEGLDEESDEEESDDEGELIDEDSSQDLGDEQILKVDLSDVSEIWFVKKNEDGSEKIASLDIVSKGNSMDNPLIEFENSLIASKVASKFYDLKQLDSWEPTEVIKKASGMRDCSVAEYQQALAKAGWPAPRYMPSKRILTVLYMDRGTEVAQKTEISTRGKKTQVSYMCNPDYLK